MTDQEVRQIVKSTVEAIFGLNLRKYLPRSGCECGELKGKVVQTRNWSGFIIRNKKCTKCGRRYVTVELVVSGGEDR